MKPLQIGELQAKVPVIQGGMGVGISLSKLAGNVALCGGVGVISSAQIGFRDPEFASHPIETNLRVLKEEIKKAKEIARGGIIGTPSFAFYCNLPQYVKETYKRFLENKIRPLCASKNPAIRCVAPAGCSLV